MRRKTTADAALAPRWVVTPTATAANHLRVRLAQTAGPGVRAGVRVVNLPRFAQRLATGVDQPAAAPRWSPALELLLAALVGDLADRSALAELRGVNGGAGLLRETFLDLAEGGFGPAHRDTLIALAEEPDLSALERATLDLYVGWLDALGRTGAPWEPLAQQALADRLRDADDDQLRRLLGAEAGQPVRVAVHGFYEWTDVNLQLLTELARRVELTIYFPHRPDHHGFAFTAEVIEDLRFRLGPDLAGETTLDPAPAGADEPATFFLASFPEGEVPPAQPSFLTHQHASGPRAEAVSAALRIRQWLDDPRDPLAPEDILVVAPDAEAYRDVIEEVFAAFGIPVRIADVAAGPVPERAAPRLLARLWEDRAPAEWVLAFLRECPDAPIARGLDRDRFEDKVRTLRVWGDSAWRAALRVPDLGAPEENRYVPRFDAAERAFIEELLAFVPPENEPPAPTLTIAAARAQLRRLQDQWLADPAPLLPLLAAVDTLAKFSPRARVDRRLLTRLLAETGGDPNLPDPLTRGVLFVPLLRARSLTARALVVLGLAAGQLPFRVPDSPLLSELSLEHLAHTAHQLGHWFSLKSRVTDELTLLFLLLNTAADQIHWVVPETDAAGKAVTATPWVQRYLQRWAAGARAAQPAQRGPAPPAASALARIARGPADQARFLAALDDGAGVWLPPRLGVYLEPALAAGFEPGVEPATQRPRRAKEPAPAVAARIGIGHSGLRRPRINVTALERLARCPFQFYAQDVCGWEGLAPLGLAHELDALEQGTVLHELLQRTLRPQLDQQPLGAIATALLANDARALRARARDLPRVSAKVYVALAMLPPTFQEAALRDTVGRAITYLRSVADSLVTPVGVEETVRRPCPGLAGIEIVGKIDRRDRAADGVWLLDYKSGREPAGSVLAREVAAGFRGQPIWYPWLAAATNAPIAGFRYVFFGDDPPADCPVDDPPAAEPLLATLTPIVAAGAYLPTSREVLAELGITRLHPCQYCPWASVCRRFEPGQAARLAPLFAQLAPARVAALQAVGGEPPPNPKSEIRNPKQ